MGNALPPVRRAFVAPGEHLDTVIKAVGRGFRTRGYRVIYWRPGVALSELDCFFAADQQQCAVDFQALMYQQGFTAERYLVEFQPVSLTWSSGRCTDYFERRYVLLQSMTRSPAESVRNAVEFPGGRV